VCSLVLERFLSIDHSLDSVVHVLDELLLGDSETASVGDVEETLLSLGGLTGGSTDLHVVLVGDGLEGVHVLAEEWESDVDGGTEGGSEVGWARGDGTEMVVLGELGLGLNGGNTTAESVEDGEDISSLLHGDDSELVLLVNPDKEGLVGVVEDSSARWPVTVESASLKEAVSLHEQEVIVDELLLSSLIHALEWVEGTSEVTLTTVESLSDGLHDLESLLLGDTWSKWIGSEVTASTDTGGHDHSGILLWESWAKESLRGHVSNVLAVLAVTVVVLDDLIEELGEGGVGVVRSSVGTNVGVWVLAAREDASLEGDTRRVRLVLVLVPDLLGEGLLEEGVAVIWELWPVLEVLW